MGGVKLREGFDVLLAVLCFILFAALYSINAGKIDDAIIFQNKKIVEYIALVPFIPNSALYLCGLIINQC